MTYHKADIAYCSNVHPGESINKVNNNLIEHFSAVRAQRNLTKMASGLWLSAQAADELLAQPPLLANFKNLLQQQGVLLTSLNGFPYGDFHLTEVKQKVYLPTWAQTERLTYSQQLADILAHCLPENISTGAISTLPLGYAKDWTAEQMQRSAEQLIALAQYLKNLEHSSGKRLIVCLEMEPDCVLQSTDELVAFFTVHLLPKAEQIGCSKSDILRYIGCCYDTCHQGVMNENIKQSLTKIAQAGIEIGKIQISNAVHAELNSAEDISELTTLFKDIKFLHQTKVFQQDTLLAELADLNEQALLTVFNDYQSNLPLTAKIHYHIPINQTALPKPFLSSTQAAILSTLDFLKVTPSCRPYLEIETYTWLNLIDNNSQQSQTLHQGLVAEFTWLEQALTERNLLNTSLLTP